jgi:hypothetical protein
VTDYNIITSDVTLFEAHSRASTFCNWMCPPIELIVVTVGVIYKEQQLLRPEEQ